MSTEQFRKFVFTNKPKKQMNALPTHEPLWLDMPLLQLSHLFVALKLGLQLQTPFVLSQSFAPLTVFVALHRHSVSL